MNLTRVSFLLLLSSLTLIATFSSCTKDVEDRLPGQWNYNETGTSTTTYDGNLSSQDINRSGIITFNEDGTGSLNVDATLQSITWTASNDSVKITDNEQLLDYAVLTNDKTLQVWEGKHTETGNDFTFVKTVEVTLTQ